MITKLDTTYYKGKASDVYMVCGSAGRDAEDKPVGGKPHAVVSLPVKEKQDGTTMWINLNGWRNQYTAVAGIRKGDGVLAIGTLREREYNGRTYYDLDADFVAVSRLGGSADENRSALADRIGSAGFAAIDEEDGELPF